MNDSDWSEEEIYKNKNIFNEGGDTMGLSFQQNLSLGTKKVPQQNQLF